MGRIREELQVVEKVAAQIQTKYISETNRLLYATAVVVTEILARRKQPKNHGRKDGYKDRWISCEKTSAD